MIVNSFSKFSFSWFDWRFQIPLLIVSIGLFALMVAVARRKARRKDQEKGAHALKRVQGSVAAGRTKSGEAIFVNPSQRSMHTQVIGTTNAGKTESVILPWAIQDIMQGRGLIIIDGKADRGILEKLFAYVTKAKRASEFRLLSLSNVGESQQFNPLLGGSPEEVTERVFNAFDIENPYYKAIQFEVMVQIMRIFHQRGFIPTFQRLYEAVTNPSELMVGMESSSLKDWLEGFIALPAKDRLERTSGLVAAFSQFAFGEHSKLFNAEHPTINLEKALERGEIIYFQLPVLLSPFLGKATGKLILQCLQGAVANRHRKRGSTDKFFAVFLDDFTEYLYPGFVSILNKSRSAKVGVVFAHQALGDIKTLGDSVANAILTNSNLKVFMRGSDPESAEYFARVIGTKASKKFTERAKRSFIGDSSTGDASVREVEEFLIHPNKFKSGLGLGEAVIVVPHERGSRVEVVKFQKLPDLLPKNMPEFLKTTASSLRELNERF